MRLTLRIEIKGQQKFGPGKARLLELIAEYGSITAAARAMGMSYRRAWMLVDDLNSMFAGKLVDAKPGGAGGGGAHLTDLGRGVLAAYRRIEEHAASAPDLIVLQTLVSP